VRRSVAEATNDHRATSPHRDAAMHRWDPPPLSPLHSGASPPHTPCPAGVLNFGELRHEDLLLWWQPESHCYPRRVATVHAPACPPRLAALQRRGSWADPLASRPGRPDHAYCAGQGRQATSVVWSWAMHRFRPSGQGGKEIPFLFPRIVKSVSNFQNSYQIHFL
jgi:hypothetical protein